MYLFIVGGGRGGGPRNGGGRGGPPAQLSPRPLLCSQAPESSSTDPSVVANRKSHQSLGSLSFRLVSKGDWGRVSPLGSRGETLNETDLGSIKNEFAVLLNKENNARRRSTKWNTHVYYSIYFVFSKPFYINFVERHLVLILHSFPSSAISKIYRLGRKCYLVMFHKIKKLKLNKTRWISEYECALLSLD